MKFYIYTLSHPTTKEIRYIGKTNNISRRYSAHLNDKSKSHKNSWIKSLLNEDLLPIIEVLEEFDLEKDCYEAEIYWIEQFKAWGFNLTNLQIGGIGGTSENLSCENSPTATLTNKQVLEIKNLLLTTDLSIKSIANQFNVTDRLIYNITSGSSWSKLTGFTGKENWVRQESVKNRAKALKDKGVYDKQSISVEQYNLEGILLNTFKSITEASLQTKTNHTSISQCINNKSKTANHFIWKRKLK